MSSFACPHYDPEKDHCLRLKTDCVPGRKGCIVPKSTVFLVPAEERVALREAERRTRQPATAGAARHGTRSRRRNPAKRHA